ncbi:MAG: metallophosphoesterase [Methyloceanibacter sp.]
MQVKYSLANSACSQKALKQAMADQDILIMLEKRLGAPHARQRLEIEKDHEAQVFGQGINFFHFENLPLSHIVIRAVLMMTGLYRRGIRNAAKVDIRHNRIESPHLPRAFDGFTIAQLSDLHVEMSEAAMKRVVELIGNARYDICVLTGDYRGGTCGPYDTTLAAMARIRASLRGPIYAVLGNHDTVCMVPGLEAMGIRMLLNESDVLERSGQRLHLSGIDDAHFYAMDDIEKAAAAIPDDEFSILISHTPEVYRQAAHAGFNLLLSGHTHGGQICLPGGIPITLDSVLPRSMGAGPWKYRDMIGYTSVGAGSSVVPVRFNCPPEVTLHCLHLSSR